MVRTIDAPADTTMMRIVHDALRRDLGRAATALSCRDATPAQRRAIGGHLRWMMGFLHAHHASEDAGLYPLVRERAAGDPQGLDVLDRMTRDHEAVAVEVAKVEAAAAALAESGSDDVTRATAAALDGLGVVLLPHLREEENEAMPTVSRLITAGEWDALEKVHNLDQKSMTQLAFEGHWLIDGATDVDRAAVVGLVPPVPRFLLLHALAGPYRRRSRDCWEIGGKPKRRVQLDNTVTVTVSTDIHEVWEVVSDVTRVGEWSHECLNAQWLGSSTSAVPGARFRGRNRAGMFRWGRVCEIVSAEPYELVWFTVPTVLFPDSSEWRITLDRVVGGTRIAQQFHVLRAPKVLSVLYALLIPAHRDRTAALIDDLERLATVAMGPRPVSSRIARSGAEGVS
jgi:hypothetical protein